jgi:glutaredoxin
MKRSIKIGLLLALPLTVGAALAGELYRWVDAHGVVSYSDQPPPSSVKKSEKLKGRKGNVVETDKETYDLKQAKSLSPVTLYVNDCGPYCDQAKDFLKQRGVPYTLRDPTSEPEIAVELKKLTGTLEVPVLVVGGTHYKGLDPVTWGRLLDAANYPKAAEKKTPGKEQ